jgi:hypothetical protein
MDYWRYKMLYSLEVSLIDVEFVSESTVMTDGDGETNCVDDVWPLLVEVEWMSSVCV